MFKQYHRPYNKMENTTTRLAVQIQNHPPSPFSLDDSTPQKSCSELKEEDILPMRMMAIIFTSE